MCIYIINEQTNNIEIGGSIFMARNKDKNNEEIKKEHTIQSLGEKVDELALQLEAANIAEYVRFLNNRKKLLFNNLLSGIARGVGIGIGFLVFATLLVYILQKLGALNLPIIGDFIAELVRIVQAQLNMDNPMR